MNRKNKSLPFLIRGQRGVKPFHTPGRQRSGLPRFSPFRGLLSLWLGIAASVSATLADPVSVHGALEIFTSTSDGNPPDESTPLLADPQARFYRVGDINLAFTLDYRVEGPISVYDSPGRGTVFQSGTVAFAPGEMEKRVRLDSLPPVDDFVTSPFVLGSLQAFVLTLLNPSPPAQATNDPGGRDRTLFYDDEISTMLDVAFQPSAPDDLVDIRNQNGPLPHPWLAPWWYPWNSMGSPDGGMFLLGDFDHVNGDPRPGLARLTAQGELDAQFSPSASVLPDISMTQIATSTRDGGVLLVRRSSPNSLVRLQSDGSSDPNFQSQAYLEPKSNAEETFLFGAWEELDGGFLLAGHFKLEGAVGAGLIRIQRNGTVDPDFKPVTLFDNCLTVVRQPDGKILIGGEHGVGLQRLLPDGTPDDTFGATDPSETAARTLRFWAIQPLPDGRILAASHSYFRGFRADGSLDPTLPSADYPFGGFGDPDSGWGPRFTIQNGHAVTYSLANIANAPRLSAYRNPSPSAYWIDPGKAPKTSFLVQPVSTGVDPSTNPVAMVEIVRLGNSK